MIVTVDPATITDDLRHRPQKVVEGRTGATAVTTAVISLLLRAKVATRFPHRLATAQMAAIEDAIKLHQETHTYPAIKAAAAETAQEDLVNQTIANNAADPATQATRVTATQTSDAPTAMIDDRATLETSPAIGETVERDHVVRIGGTTETEEMGATIGAGTMTFTGDGRSVIQRFIISAPLEIFGVFSFGCRGVILTSTRSMAGVYCLVWNGRTIP